MEQVNDLSEALPMQTSPTYHVEVLQDPCRRVLKILRAMFIEYLATQHNEGIT